MRVRSEKEILCTGGETGGKGEHVVVDLTELKREEYIPIVQAKRTSVAQAMKECLLVMKEMHDSSGGQGTIYDLLQQERVGEWLHMMVDHSRSVKS